MVSTVDQFREMLDQMGSDVTYHREGTGEACPCRTPEGFRDPGWHHVNSSEPVCNEQGFLSPATIDFVVKASIQPALPQRGLRRAAQRDDALLGELERDDHVGIFPVAWNGHTLDFYDWGDAGEDFILYDNRRYVVVAADKLPDVDGNPSHHWEVALRHIKTGRPS